MLSYYKQMVGQSSKLNLIVVPDYSVKGIVWLALTGRTSKPILKASIGRSGRNVWDGQSIMLSNYQNARVWQKSFWRGIITTDLTWAKACYRH